MFIAAFDFLKRYPLDINVTEFETSCGVGVVVTTKDIEDEVSAPINSVYTCHCCILLGHKSY